MSVMPRETTLLRLLLPVAASVVLVAVLIANGIRQDRVRLGAYADSQRQALAFMRTFRADAVEYLRARQGADGSWTSGTAADRTTSADPDLNGTLRILLNVRRAGYAKEPLFADGLRFARSQEDRAKLSPLGRLLLLPSPAARDETTAPAAFSPRTPPNAPVDLGDDVLRLGTLPPGGEDASRLLDSIRSRLRSAPPSAPAWLRLGYLGTLAAESGSPEVSALLRDVLVGFRAGVGPDPWDDLDDLGLAAYVEILGRDCRARNDPCEDGNRALRALAERRRTDGSWSASTLTLAGDRGGASELETTSLALAALAVFEEVLRRRFGL